MNAELPTRTRPAQGRFVNQPDKPGNYNVRGNRLVPLWTSLPTVSLGQQRPGAPQHRGLAVEIAGLARAVQIILRVILLVGAHAHVADIAVGVNFSTQADPAAPRHVAVAGIEPAMLHAHHQGVGEHAGATRFVVSLVVVHQLPPQAGRGLIGFQRGHHFLVAVHQPRVLGMVGRERIQNFRERGGEPAVAAAPEMVAHVGVEKKAVRLLQLVEIRGQLGGDAVGVFRIVRRAIGLDLEAADHETVVHPPARFFREAVGTRIDPLVIGHVEAQVAVTGVAVEQINLQRQNAEDVKVHMALAGNGLGAGGRQNGGVARGELLLQRLVAGHVGKPQRAERRADFGINDETVGVVINGARQKIRADFFADDFRVAVRRQVLEGIFRGRIFRHRAAGETQRAEKQRGDGKKPFVHGGT